MGLWNSLKVWFVSEGVFFSFNNSLEEMVFHHFFGELFYPPQKKHQGIEAQELYNKSKQNQIASLDKRKISLHACQHHPALANRLKEKKKDLIGEEVPKT